MEGPLVQGTRPWMAVQCPLILSNNSSTQKTKKLILYHYAYYMPRCNFVQLFFGASDGHVTFTTSLRLDASFAMAPHALRPDLDRVKSASGFEVKTDQTCLPRF